MRRIERLFLLSPAHCGGERARMLLRREASFPLAIQLRSTGGAPLGEVFSFLSGLYFRGKVTYASTFARPSPAGILIITASDGLQPPDHVVTLRDIERYATVPVSPDEPRYRDPLARAAQGTLQLLRPSAQVILLGSLATDKYIEVLRPIFGERLHYPSELLGRGDMSRGALLLRCVREGRELDYVRLERALPGKRCRSG